MQGEEIREKVRTETNSKEMAGNEQSRGEGGTRGVLPVNIKEGVTKTDGRYTVTWEQKILKT